MEMIVNHDLPIITQEFLKLDETGVLFEESEPNFQFYSDIDGYRMISKSFDLKCIITKDVPIYFHLDPYSIAGLTQQHHYEKLQYHGISNLGKIQTLPFLTIGNIDVALMWYLQPEEEILLQDDFIVDDELHAESTRVLWLEKKKGGDAIIEWFYTTLLSKLPMPYEARYSGILTSKKPILLGEGVWKCIQETANDIWHETKWNLPEFFQLQEPKLFISYFGQKDTSYKLPVNIFKIEEMKYVWIAAANTACIKNHICCWRRSWIKNELINPTIFRVALTESMASGNAYKFSKDSIMEPICDATITKILLYGEYSYTISNMCPSDPPGPYNGTSLNHTILHSLNVVQDEQLANTLGKEVKYIFQRIKHKLDEKNAHSILDTMKYKTFGARSELTLFFNDTSAEIIHDALSMIESNFEGKINIYKHNNSY